MKVRAILLLFLLLHAAYLCNAQGWVMEFGVYSGGSSYSNCDLRSYTFTAGSATLSGNADGKKFSDRFLLQGTGFIGNVSAFMSLLTPCTGDFAGQNTSPGIDASDLG